MGVRVTPELGVVSSFPVIADPGVEREPDIAYDGQNYLVVWSDGIFGYDHQVRGARMTSEGAVIDTGVYFGVNAYYEYRPCVEFDGDRYLAIWNNYSDDPYGLFGHFINTQCELEGDKIDIRLIDYAYSLEPDIAYRDSNYLVVWNERSSNVDDDVYGQIIDRNGALINGPIPIAVSADYENMPRVCAGPGRFLVVWNCNSIVFGQWVSSSGELIGGNFRISLSNNNNRNNPDAAIGDDNALIAWHEFTLDNFDIYGNVITVVGTIEEKSLYAGSPQQRTIFINDTKDMHYLSGWKIFDASGREVDVRFMKDGVYFIEMPGKIFRKAIRIK